MGLIRRACWVALLSISDAGARPPAGKGEGVAPSAFLRKQEEGVFSIVSFLVLLLVVRKTLRSRLPAFAQWDFTADWTSGFDFAQIVRGGSRRTN